MSAWNKYGTIKKDGRIDARFYCLDDDINVNACEKAAQLGQRYDQQVTLHHKDGQTFAVLNGDWLARLPSAWTQLVGEIKSREVVGTATISDHEGGYRVRIDIDES